MQINKTKVIAALRRRLSDNLNALAAAQGAAQSGAVHEETRQEDPKDTRAIEATYLARGLAERVETLRSEIAVVGSMEPRTFAPEDAIALGALLGIEDEEGAETAYFLAPCGGGEKITVEGTVIQVLTTTSPLGSALIERCVGDDFALELPNRHFEACVIWVA